MKTKYNIPQKELDFVIRRDIDCVYCHKKWGKDKCDSISIEHLNHKLEWDSVRSFIQENKPVREIIALCCGSCNSSRGSKSLRSWFNTPYCIRNKITSSNVALVVKKYLDEYEKVE